MKDVWYYHQNLKPQGPLSLQEMRTRIHRGEIGPMDLVCHEADGSWKPACEWSVFEASLFPAAQAFIYGQDVRTDEKEWVLLVPSKEAQSALQEGPFSISELNDLLRAQKISAQHYIWKPGLSGWCRLKDRPEFAALNLEHP